jgi:hypothetical protein
MQRPVQITNPELPGSRGTCLPSALSIWLDRGWVLYEPEQAAPVPTFHEVNGEMVPDPIQDTAPEWTAPSTSKQKAKVANADEEQQT